VPTYEVEPGFYREYAHLTPAQRAAFKRAVREMIEDLRARKTFRPGLRVKGVQGHAGVFEMTWASDGQATFHYGRPRQQNEAHIVWRRIGNHEIFDRS
jgi:hypothetical protein